MINRDISKKLLYYSTKYPIVTVTGPRQSGKSTLIRNVFPDYKYISLEDPDVLMMIKDDTRLFLKNFPDKTIIDEAQRYPELFSYLQTHVDSVNKEGMYILSGSHNFLLMEKISQTLAGRTAVLKLLPFTYSELTKHGVAVTDIDELIFRGFYPRIYDKNLKSEEFYPFYIQTYIERDVRSLINITDLNIFTRFLKLCAGRTGQLLNLSALSNESGISQPTAKAWLSALEASYLIYLLKPYHKNFNKRLVKTPKLFFYDTGLACALLGLKSKEQLNTHYLRDGLFENWVITEYIKSIYNKVEEPQVHFWRNNIGNEIDLIIEDGSQIRAVEIKSGATFRADFFKGLNYWAHMSGIKEHSILVYGGDNDMQTKYGKLVSWRNWTV